MYVWFFVVFFLQSSQNIIYVRNRTRHAAHEGCCCTRVIVVVFSREVKTASDGHTFSGWILSFSVEKSEGGSASSMCCRTAARNSVKHNLWPHTHSHTHADSRLSTTRRYAFPRPDGRRRHFFLIFFFFLFSGSCFLSRSLTVVLGAIVVVRRRTSSQLEKIKCIVKNRVIMQRRLRQWSQ